MYSAGDERTPSMSALRCRLAFQLWRKSVAHRFFGYAIFENRSFTKQRATVVWFVVLNIIYFGFPFFFSTVIIVIFFFVSKFPVLWVTLYTTRGGCAFLGRSGVVSSTARFRFSDPRASDLIPKSSVVRGHVFPGTLRRRCPFGVFAITRRATKGRPRRNNTRFDRRARVHSRLGPPLPPVGRRVISPPVKESLIQTEKRKKKTLWFAATTPRARVRLIYTQSFPPSPSPHGTVRSVQTIEQANIIIIVRQNLNTAIRYDLPGVTIFFFFFFSLCSAEIQ